MLGLVSADERQEVEIRAAEHPEIKAAIGAFELALEKQAIDNAVAPPSALKAQIMAALETEGMRLTAGLPLDTVSSSPEPAKVISLTSAPKGIKWLRGAIAAAILLLLGSSILNFYFYSQYKKYNGQYTDLLAKQTEMVARNTELEANYHMLKDTAMTQIKMGPAAPERAGSMATVLWDKNSRDVYLMVNNLPAHPTDKQYQLWAIVDGKPVDAGMLDMTAGAKGLVHMKSITGNVQMFAITLERKGGSPTPDMQQMYVVGRLSPNA